MGKIRLGTSGWSYNDWIGPFYKRREKMLSAYTKIFETVEIDSTFYAYPSKGMVMGWTRYSPPDFVFSAKLPKLITHEKMLSLKEGVEDDLKRFCDLMQILLLNGKLGCLLIQLPPKFSFDFFGRLEKFFDILPVGFKFAVEFRNLSWMKDETWKLLRKYGVTYTIVDEPLLPPEVKITSSRVYFRWHGRGVRPWFNYRYKIDELRPWGPKVKEVAKKVETVYGYFNNHFHGYAVENCLQVLKMLGALNPRQSEAKAQVEHYMREMSKKRKFVTLETFEKPIAKGLEEMFGDLIDNKRLIRAKYIKDEEIRVEEMTDNTVRASIRDYRIIIDLEKCEVLHDCADWSRVLPYKKFCKHVGKLMLFLPEEKAKYILERINTEREKWGFKSYTKNPTSN